MLSKKDLFKDGKKSRGVLRVKKLSVLSLVVLCLCVMVALNVTPLAIVVATRKIPIYCVDRQDKSIALTFDAAWGADKTKQILDVCDKYNVKVTFFLVGFWTEKYPELVKEIADRGHAIGTHSETHPKMTGLSAAKQQTELVSSVKKITDITFKDVKIFRPPFGDYDNSVIETATSLGLSTIQWSVDSLDWKGISAVQIADRVLKASAGDIILCHNNSDHIVEALPVILQGFLDRGFTFATVEDLIYYEDFYIDHTGRQIKNKTNID